MENNNFEQGLRIMSDFLDGKSSNTNGARDCFEKAKLEGYPYAQDAINLLRISKKKYLGIFNTLKEACIDEKACAQNEMGIAYEKGISQLMPSKDDALRWFELAAKNGHIYALGRVVWYYRDREKVLEWNPSIGCIDDRDWQKLIEITHEPSFSNIFKHLVAATYIDKETDDAVRWQFEMGLCYDEGVNGLKTSDDDAARWYLIAAGNGSVEAQSKLAWYYVEGRGVEKDMEKARYWYQMSANNGYEQAKTMLASRLFNPDAIKSIEEVSPSFVKDLEKELKRYQEFSGCELSPATDSDIEEAEEILGFKLPEAYKCFVKMCDGIFCLANYEELYINGLDSLSETAQMRDDNLIKHSFELYGDGLGNGLYWDSWTGCLFDFEHEYKNWNFPDGIKQWSLESAILDVLRNINESFEEDDDYYDEEEWDEWDE